MGINLFHSSSLIQAYLGYYVTPSNYGLYPRIHRGEIVSRRAVGPRWHDAVAQQCVIFRSEVGILQPCQRARIVLDKQYLPAFIYLLYNAWVNIGSDWLPPSKAAVRIGMRAMSPAVSGEFSQTENSGYSACHLWNKRLFFAGDEDIQQDLPAD
jgi:hypothetical protein